MSETIPPTGDTENKENEYKKLAESIISDSDAKPKSDKTEKTETTGTTEEVGDTDEEKVNRSDRDFDSDISLAHSMALIEDKGHNEAASIMNDSEAAVKTAKRSAAAYKGRGNSEAADKKTEDAARIPEIAKAESGNAIKTAQDNSEGALEAWRTEKNKNVEQDVEVAHAMALGEKQFTEQAMSLEKKPDTPETKRQTEAREDTARLFREHAEKASAEAAKGERANIERNLKQAQDLMISSSTEIKRLSESKEPGHIAAIGVNESKSPREAQELAYQLMTSLGVDLAAPSIRDVKQSGPRVFGRGERTEDYILQSKERGLENVAFVVQRNAKTGEFIRLDVVSAPKDGKQREWNRNINEQIQESRRLPLAPGGSKGTEFLPDAVQGKKWFSKNANKGGSSLIGGLDQEYRKNSKKQSIWSRWLNS